MRVLVIGKYPPIQGGVSTQTFWATHQLAELGHDVHVVSNSEVVEYGFREFFVEGDREFLTGQHGAGRVVLHTTAPVQPFSYIPSARPYGTQLFGLSAQVMESHDIDCVIGWYFEPYGVAAAHVAKAFEVPLILRHAGSDIGRLTKYPDVASAFGCMARQSRVLFTNRGKQSVSDILASLGFSGSQMRQLHASPLSKVYTANPEPLDLNKLVPEFSSWYRSLADDPALLSLASELNTGSINPSNPTIGAYGKIGKTKGSYDLIRALDGLAAAGVPFNFLVIAAGRQGELRKYFNAILSSPRLCERTWVLPPLAPWQIPSFLSHCDIGCFLEREFPIEFHHSTIPREILASGRMLICSEEMARKLPFSSNLVNGKNCVLVCDPRDTEELSGALRRSLSDETYRDVIARHGKYLSEFWETELSGSRGFAGQIEDLVQSWSG